MDGLYKVLVVDDEMLIRQGIINYINWEEEGFRIIGEASNGNEALQFIEKSKPDIIFTDVVMPDMDGIELVRTVKEFYPSIEIVVLSSFEKFDYVRTTFQHGVADYILKPKLNGEELISILRKIAPDPIVREGEDRSVSLEEVLNKKISGYSLTNRELALMEEFPCCHFSLIAICGYDNELSFEEIEMAWKQQISQVECFLVSENVSDAMVVLLNFNQDQLMEVQESLAVLADNYRDAGQRSHWLMSKAFSSIYELPSVYKENLLIIKDYLFYLTDEKVLIDGFLPEIKECQPFNLGRFIECLKQKKFEKAIRSLNEHVSYLTCNYKQDIFEFKSWLENIIFNVIVLLGNMNYDVDDLETKKYDYFAVINEAKQAKEAIACFYDFLESVQTKVMTENHPNHPENILRLLQYIEDHYQEPLSLTTLAEYFHFNPSYLSSYFSNHLQIGFSDYLNQVRITKAKHMLETTSASISQISAMAGYSEPSYFCKVFKRSQGVSPGNYRRKIPAMN